MNSTTSTLSTMLTNLSSSYTGLFQLLFTGFWVAGLVCVIWGVNNFRHATEDHRGGGPHPVTAALVSIMIGAVLCYLPTLLQSLAYTAFVNTTGPAGLVDYETPSSSSTTFASLRTLWQLVGVYFFGRGWLTLRKIGIHGESSSATFYGATVRIFCGIAMVHVVDVLVILSNTFGFTSVSSWVQSMS